MMNLRTGYMKLNRAIAERAARRQARNGNDPERPTRAESDAEAIRKSTAAVQTAMKRLFSAIDEALR